MAQMGRPKIEVRMDLVDTACTFNATVKQVLDILANNDCRISEDRLANELRDRYGMTFSEYRDQKVSAVRLKLIQKAVKMALDGNSTMLIFTLKNLCGWRDRFDEAPHQVSEEDKKIALAYEIKPRVINAVNS